MTRKSSLKILWLLVLYLTIESLSFAGFFNPAVSQIVFIILSVSTLILSLYSLEYGLLVVLAELFIGSMGHLFSFSWGTHQLSIRIALWSIMMLVFGGQFIYKWVKQGQSSPYWQALKSFSGRKIMAWLFLFIFIGLLNGWLKHNNPATILLDFNAWPYFLTILPAIIVYGNREESVLERLKIVFLASMIWLSLKTLFLVFIFTHNYGLAADIYTWLRQTLVGEMTPTVTGWPRVFIQGQIFSAIVFIIIFWFQESENKFKNFFTKQNIFSLGLAALFLSSVLLSFSRSFWVGIAGAVVLSLIFIWHQENFKKMILEGFWILAALILSFILINLVVAFPYWHSKSANFGASFLARADSGNDAAVASRWSLLPVLLNKIEQEPFLGQGFGSTVTYFSRDPRVLQNNPSGAYKTYAFEWGYLSLWLKIGLIGLVVYLLFLWQLIAGSLKIARQTKNYLFFALPAGILFLAITNAFTPYLNHPLGIGFLVISSCLIWPNRVY